MGYESPRAYQLIPVISMGLAVSLCYKPSHTPWYRNSIRSHGPLDALLDFAVLTENEALNI